MLYVISAALKQMYFTDESVFASLGIGTNALAGPPGRPSSTR